SRGRGGVCDDDELPILGGAPTNGVALAVFNQVDGAVSFVGPPGGCDAPATLVDQDQGTRRDKRVHGPVLSANVCVAIATEIETVHQHEREFAPSLDEPAQKSCAADVYAGVER